MKTIIPILVFISLLLSGCIEIIEEITIREDASGTIHYRLNTSELLSLADVISENLDESIQGAIEPELEKFAKELSGKKGITKVEYRVDARLDIYELRFDFSGDRELNDALYEFFKVKKNILTPAFLKISPHRLVRKNFSPSLHKYLALQDTLFKSDEILKWITFKTVIIPPEKITRAKGENVRISNDGKKAVQSHKLDAILKNTADVGIKVRF